LLAKESKGQAIMYFLAQCIKLLRCINNDTLKIYSDAMFKFYKKEIKMILESEKQKHDTTKP
jgi:hypothetical protein